MVPEYNCENDCVDSWWCKVCDHGPGHSENEDKNAKKISISDGPSYTNAVKGLAGLLRKPRKQDS